MTVLEEILASLRAEMRRLDALMGQQLEGRAEAAIADVRPGAGKRLRAALVLLASQFGSGGEDAVLRVAAGAEFVHSATLVHDDIIDASPLRRGEASIHAAHGAAAAILAGDFYLMRGFSLFAQTGDARIPEVFAQAVAQICVGEMAHARRSWAKPPSQTEYLEAVEAKTATLMAACTYAAALVSDCGDAAAVRLREYGRLLGIAFQIADDILDYTGSESELGKPAGEDLRSGTVTLPLMLALEEPEVRDRIAPLLGGTEPPGEDEAAAVVAVVRDSVAIPASKVRARQFVDAAKSELHHLPDSVARQSLLALADFSIARIS